MEDKITMLLENRWERYDGKRMLKLKLTLGTILFLIMWGCASVYVLHTHQGAVQQYDICND